MVALRVLTLAVTAGLYTTVTLAAPSFFDHDKAHFPEGLGGSIDGLSLSDSEDDASLYSQSSGRSTGLLLPFNSEDSAAQPIFERPPSVPTSQNSNSAITTPADLAQALVDLLKLDLATNNPYAHKSIAKTLKVITKVISAKKEPDPVSSLSKWYQRVKDKPRVDPELTYAQRAVRFFRAKFDENPDTVRNGIDLYAFIKRLGNVEDSISDKPSQTERAELHHALGIITNLFVSQMDRFYDTMVALVHAMRIAVPHPGRSVQVGSLDWPEVVKAFLEVHVAQGHLQLRSCTRLGLYEDMVYKRRVNHVGDKSWFVKLMLHDELDYVVQHPTATTQELVTEFLRNGEH